MPGNKIIPLTQADHDVVRSFTRQHAFIQSHLDWRLAEDWLGHQPFLLLTIDDLPEALLACPEDPPHVGWIRFFACKNSKNINTAFGQLLTKALETWSENRPEIAAVALHKWYETLLLNHNFSVRQKIVVLERVIDMTPRYTVNENIHIRPMTPDDFATVHRVDNIAFEPLWQLSEAGIRAAHKQSTYATVAEHQGEIIAYQISNINLPSAHLSRLAVLPDWQRQQIGQNLVNDLVAFYYGLGANQVTVNTQDDNPASLHVYQKLGFRMLPESFPVLTYQPNQ